MVVNIVVIILDGVAHIWHTSHKTFILRYDIAKFVASMSAYLISCLHVLMCEPLKVIHLDSRNPMVNVSGVTMIRAAIGAEITTKPKSTICLQTI